MTRKLRAVSEGEKAQDLPELDLMQAVETGDRLLILRAQRKIMARGLMEAEPNVRAQHSQDLTKLCTLIEEEEQRRSLATADDSVAVDLEAVAWDGTGF